MNCLPRQSKWTVFIKTGKGIYFSGHQFLGEQVTLIFHFPVLFMYNFLQSETVFLTNLKAGKETFLTIYEDKASISISLKTG